MWRSGDNKLGLEKYIWKKMDGHAGGKSKWRGRRKLGSGGILAVRGGMFQEGDGSDYTECCQRVE